MRSLVSSAYGNFRFMGSGMKITCNFESLPYGVDTMAGRIGARPSAEPGVALLAPATSSTPLATQYNCALSSRREARSCQGASSELQLLTPAKRPLLARPCRFGVNRGQRDRCRTPTHVHFGPKATVQTASVRLPARCFHQLVSMNTAARCDCGRNE